MKSKFIKCECGTHALEISMEDFEGHGEKLVYIALWNHGYVGQRGLLDRLKMAWRLIFKGGLHSDHVVLTQEGAKELNDYVQKEILP